MRIELTRSILLGGETAEHAEKGAIYDVPRVLALDLIAQESAVRCGSWRFIFLWATGVDVKPRRIAEAKPQADHSGRSQDETVFPIGGNVDRTEKANEVMQRAEKLGIRLTFDSGLAFAELAATAEPEISAMATEQVVKYLPEVHAFLKQRNIGARAKDFVGRRVWSHEFGPGELIDAQNSGDLTIVVEQEGWNSLRQLQTRAENILILLDKEPDSAGGVSSSPDDKPRSAKPWRVILQWLRLSKDA